MTTMEKKIKKLLTQYSTSKRGFSFSSMHINQRKPKENQPTYNDSAKHKRIKAKIN